MFLNFYPFNRELDIMKNFWTFPFIFATVANLARPGKGEDLSIHVVVPKYVKEGDTVTLKCTHDVSKGTLGTLTWFKGSEEFYRVTPSEVPSVKVFPLNGVNVNISKSNESTVTLEDVRLPSTGRYSCWIRLGQSEGLAAIKTGWMNVVALPEQPEPQITADRRSVLVGDMFHAKCTSIRSKPVATISWLINGRAADSQFVRPEVIITDFSMKETVTRRIRFRVRQGHFKKGQMVLTCKAKIEPNMYDASADIIILEKYNTDMSDGERSNGESRDNDNRSERLLFKASSTAVRITLPFLDLFLT